MARVPMGNFDEAAVALRESKTSPLEVVRPWSPGPYHEARPTMPLL
jgi:hypothetical protein